MTVDFKNQLDEIDRAVPAIDVLRTAENEGPFVGAAVDLMVETGSYVCVAAHIYPSGQAGWSRNQAIVGGHVVRLFKLIDALLDQTCKHRRETSMVFARLAFETIVNLVFLCKNCTEDVFASYIQYSMRHEKKLFDRIHSNITARDGEVLPIEQRMINSIEKKADVSGISISDASSSTPQNWAGKNLFEKAKAVGFEQAYLAVFGGGSHTVHGNWMDMLEYHLRVEDDMFHPDGEWSPPRPQILLALAKLSVEALVSYFDYLGHLDARKIMDEILSDLWQRIREVDELHETYLQKSRS